MGVGARPKRTPARAAAIAAAAALALAGCAVAPTSYDLSRAEPAVTMRIVRGALEIGDPSASEVLDSERILVRTGPDTLAYLAGAQWSERLPALVRARVVAAFERARPGRAVVAPGMVSDNQLMLDVRRFEIDVTRHEARVEIAARLIASATGRIRATKMIAGVAPAPAAADGAGPRALDAALAGALTELVGWTAAAL